MNRITPDQAELWMKTIGYYGLHESDTDEAIIRILGYALVGGLVSMNWDSELAADVLEVGTANWPAFEAWQAEREEALASLQAELDDIDATIQPNDRTIG